MSRDSRFDGFYYFIIHSYPLNMLAPFGGGGKPRQSEVYMDRMPTIRASATVAAPVPLVDKRSTLADEHARMMLRLADRLNGHQWNTVMECLPVIALALDDFKRFHSDSQFEHLFTGIRLEDMCYAVGRTQ